MELLEHALFIFKFDERSGTTFHLHSSVQEQTDSLSMSELWKCI